MGGELWPSVLTLVLGKRMLVAVIAIPFAGRVLISNRITNDASAQCKQTTCIYARVYALAAMSPPSAGIERIERAPMTNHSVGFHDHGNEFSLEETFRCDYDGLEAKIFLMAHAIQNQVIWQKVITVQKDTVVEA